MRRFIGRFLAAIGALTLLIFFGLFWSLSQMTVPSSPSFMKNDPVVLGLTLGDETLTERPSSKGLLSFVQGEPLCVYTIVEGIHHAAQDGNIKGILLNLEGSHLKLSTVQEIRDALKAFKAKGKFIYTYADTFGEFSNGTLAYYLAAATSKIYVMPMGEFNFNGMAMEVPFAKKVLETFKIHPQMSRREEYKGMVESFTEVDFTPPHRENMQRILDALMGEIIADVAIDREVEATRVKAIVNAAPHTLKEALDAKMIDAIGYKDQVKDAIQAQVGEKPLYYDFEAYAKSKTRSTMGEKIAVVYAEGLISKGKMARNPLYDDAVMDGFEVAKSIREAGEDKSIKAIVLRIDSGGGGPIPSELIWREVERLKGKKPVIVSMANYAASGGYWIACNARKIVAQPGTITGSIGVFAGKTVTQEFWDYYGVHWGEIHSGDNASIWSTGQGFSEIGRQKFERYLDDIYATFQEKVSKGRGLAPDKVHQIAKGQVWTGAEAKENGLVDALGGMGTAIQIAKEEAGLASDATVKVVHFPEPKSIIDLLLNRSQPYEIEVFARYPLLRQFLRQLDRVFLPPHAEVVVGEVIPQ